MTKVLKIVFLVILCLIILSMFCTQKKLYFKFIRNGLFNLSFLLNVLKYRYFKLHVLLLNSINVFLLKGCSKVMEKKDWSNVQFFLIIPIYLHLQSDTETFTRWSLNIMSPNNNLIELLLFLNILLFNLLIEFFLKLVLLSICKFCINLINF